MVIIAQVVGRLRQIGTKLVEELRGDRPQQLAANRPVSRVTDVNIRLGSGDTDEEEPPLLFHLVAAFAGPLVGEQAVLEADDEHVLELQALGGMERHQGHSLIRRIIGVGIAEQGNSLQVIYE